MSERKVLSKYYPPEFDPSKLTRSRGPKPTGPKVQTVRLMAPFSMKCLSCAEFIYKGRKFNARKETPPDEKYLGKIQIYRFYIRCTRCSAEITFRTDPKNTGYVCERGAKRNVEPWSQGREETDEERLDRLEREEEESNAMVDLEAKTVDAKREMAVADALDQIRTRNARLERADREGADADVPSPDYEERMRQEVEDEEAAKKAFALARAREQEQAQSDRPREDECDHGTDPDTISFNEPKGQVISPAAAPATTLVSQTMPPPPTFKRQIKRKRDHAAALGIKRKSSIA